MASQPPQRSLSQRFPQSQSSSQASSQPEPPEATSLRRSSLPQSTTSEDSQTVLLNHPSSIESFPQPEEQQPTQAPPRPKPQSAPSTIEPRKCWICFCDETEDSPTSSTWRSPCPCALTAHESCLLDWVADLEAPNKRKPAKIECPQCKTKITIARPTSPVVEFVRMVERATGRLLFPAVLVTLAGTVLTGCWLHGFATIFVICGPEDAERIMGINDGGQINSRIGLSLPFIPLSLILARTHYLDSVLPVMPIFYFASNAPRREGPLWPPSVAFTLATLPYVRAAYNEFYGRVLAPKEKAWIKEIQPRSGENGENEAQGQQGNQGDADDPGHDGINLELNLQVDLFDEEEVQAEVGDVPQQPEVPPENIAAGNTDPPGHDQEPHLEPGQQQEQPPGQQPAQPPAQQPAPEQGAVANIFVDTFAFTQKTMGALIFPTIAAAMGILLRAALPRTWTTPPGRCDRYTAGLLQSTFGRSIAGGCLFVALRDTIVLYSKYRLAQDHKQRRVVDYASKKGKKNRTSGS